MKFPFMHAAIDAIEQFENRGYGKNRAVLYTHPVTYNKALDNIDWVPYDGTPEVYGIQVEESPTIPEDIVILVHLEAMRLGPEAIAFSEV